ncbi:MAG: DUF488 domain-containing protein [Anaerolineae bacterium]
MTILYTIGYQGRSLEALVRALQSAGVDAVIDIRLHNTSQLAGYTKRDDLAFLLREGFGIAYEHVPELAPTEEILTDYRRTKDWRAWEQSYADLLAARPIEALGKGILGRYRAPCLLCAEAKPDHCHRRLVAERWAALLGPLEVRHL